MGRLRGTQWKRRGCFKLQVISTISKNDLCSVVYILYNINGVQSSPDISSSTTMRFPFVAGFHLNASTTH